ncbi:MAG TPA: porin [Oxalicibacterium sp.]|nr:porin [Oxalicibacterium sp.]
MKTLQAAIALVGFFSASAYAQTPITVYGTIDGGIRHVSNASPAGDSLKLSSNGEFYNNRLGFKGSEDLGSGIHTHFQFEMGWNTGTGESDNKQDQLFQRYALIGIDGPFGVVDIGRMPSLSCKVISYYDPFVYHYVYTIPLAGAAAGNDRATTPPFGTMGGTRFDNDIQYIAKSNGWMFGAEYSFGEAEGSSRNGSAQALAFAYSGGPLAIGGAYTMQRPDISLAGAADYRNQYQTTFGASYQLGDVRLSAGYIRTTLDTPSLLRLNGAKNLWVGASYRVTPAIGLTFGYYRTTLDKADREIARRNFAILGATYALSNRTSLYFDIDRAELAGAIAFTPGRETTQIGTSLGIYHAF